MDGCRDCVLSRRRDAAASSSTSRRLTTEKEARLEKGKQRDRERSHRESATFISSQIGCSRELLENEELHGPDQITLQNK